MRYILSALIAFTLLHTVYGAEDPAAERLKGIDALKLSQTDPRAVVAAARHFAKASELFVKAGDDVSATEMNSFLFWCKKKMTYQDIEQFTASGETGVTEKLFMVEKIIPEADDSQVWFDRAEKFATQNPTEHFLIAVRFFEVASRFIGSKPSIAAQERSLKEQTLAQQSITAAKTPAPEAVPVTVPVTPAPAAAPDKMPEHDKVPAHAKTLSPEKPTAADLADPIKRRLIGAKNVYAGEVEKAHKAMTDAFDKRESDARKSGNKKVVDEVKEERAAFDAKRLFDQIQSYPPDAKRKIAAAWKSLAAEYDTAIKDYTKAAKDDDATAIEKESKLAADEYSGAAPALAKAAPDGLAAPAAAAGMLRDKTLVAWFTLGNLKQRKGAIISIVTPADLFDGMVYAELEPLKWMAGSDGYSRTLKEQTKFPPETAAGAPIQLAISYHDHEITIYRNGKKYAQYPIAVEPQVFGPDAAVLFGIRAAASTADTIVAQIADARIYAEALSETQIGALRPSAASSAEPKPWAWWTFEDGTCRDRMGRFAPGKPLGGARIVGGLMQLTGKGYFRADPALPKKK